MLIIRRRRGEAVRIGGDVLVEVLEAGANHVLLGISAPAGVPILRRELEVTADQNRAAAEGAKNFTPGNFSSYLSRLPR